MKVRAPGGAKVFVTWCPKMAVFSLDLGVGRMGHYHPSTTMPHTQNQPRPPQKGQHCTLNWLLSQNSEQSNSSSSVLAFHQHDLNLNPNPDPHLNTTPPCVAAFSRPLQGGPPLPMPKQGWSSCTVIYWPAWMPYSQSPYGN